MLSNIIAILRGTCSVYREASTEEDRAGTEEHHLQTNVIMTRIRYSRPAPKTIVMLDPSFGGVRIFHMETQNLGHIWIEEDTATGRWRMLGGLESASEDNTEVVYREDGDTQGRQKTGVHGDSNWSVKLHIDLEDEEMPDEDNETEEDSETEDDDNDDITKETETEMDGNKTDSDNVTIAISSDNSSPPEYSISIHKHTDIEKITWHDEEVGEDAASENTTKTCCILSYTARLKVIIFVLSSFFLYFLLACFLTYFNV